MANKVNKKIVAYKVKFNEELSTAPTQAAVEIMHESIARPEHLVGATFKIKPPQLDHAMYVTINDIILNEGTEHEERRPYEIFINSKNMEHYQWVIALTRVMSAVFRKGGDACFLVDELKAVFDPKGGYFKKGGVFMPSLVSEIGLVLEKHMKSIGMLATEELSAHQKEFQAEKRKQVGADDGKFPENATVCPKCQTKAVVILDGCKTCLNCGESKCGG